MKILFVGESFVVHSTHIKGFDQFTESRYDEGGQWLIDALVKGGYEVTYMPCHIAARDFPFDLDGLKAYDAVILSDIGSNTLLMPHEVFARGEQRPDRLALLAEYVKAGGALAMMGGYMSFSGIEGKAHYGSTALKDVLPVEMLVGDDRKEAPQGITPQVVQADHPIFQSIEADWPHFLGYNILKAKPEAQVLATMGDDVFIATMEYGQGRSLAFSSDISPHWGSPAFLAWSSYDKLFSNIADWLCRKV